MDGEHRTRVGALLLMSALAAPHAVASGQGLPPLPTPRDPAHEVACGPAAAWDPPVAAMRVVAGETHGRSLFGPGEVVIVDAGSTHGLAPGQEFFVRRAFRDQFLEPVDGTLPPMTVRTAGWVRLLEVHEASSTAQILRACDAIGDGDYLEPFTLQAVPAPLAGEPDYADPARLLLGDERRQLGAAGTLMVLDRGAGQGVLAGQRLTVFRPTIEGGPVRRVAEATVMTVRPGTALIRIETARDAVFVGDLVALHK
jgi:hypothetical protein